MYPCALAIIAPIMPQNAFIGNMFYLPFVILLTTIASYLNTLLARKIVEGRGGTWTWKPLYSYISVSVHQVLFIIAYFKLGASSKFFLTCLFCAWCILISVIDFQSLLLDIRTQAVGFIIAFTTSFVFYSFPHQLLSGGVGLLIGFLLYGFGRAYSKHRGNTSLAFGLGDALLLVILAFVVPLNNFLYFLLASFVISLLLGYYRNKKLKGLAGPVPLVPGFCLSAILFFLMH